MPSLWSSQHIVLDNPFIASFVFFSFFFFYRFHVRAVSFFFIRHTAAAALKNAQLQQFFSYTFLKLGMFVNVRLHRSDSIELAWQFTEGLDRGP
jgi:hypothetical protein